MIYSFPHFSYHTTTEIGIYKEEMLSRLPSPRSSIPVVIKLIYLITSWPHKHTLRSDICQPSHSASDLQSPNNTLPFKPDFFLISKRHTIDLLRQASPIIRLELGILHTLLCPVLIPTWYMILWLLEKYKFVANTFFYEDAASVLSYYWFFVLGSLVDEWLW